MQVKVSRPGHESADYRFVTGPIYFGRHTECQVPLQDRSVSRQHAVIYLTPEGEAILTDLNSANGTRVNGQTVSECTLKTGDRIQIGNFSIAFDLDDVPQEETLEILEDTAFETERPCQRITRSLLRREGPDIIVPCGRASDLARASRALAMANDAQHLLQMLLVLLIQQFRATRAWCSLRESVEGFEACAIGVSDQGQSISLDDIALRQEIYQVLETGDFLLLPNTSVDLRVEVPGSVMIAPLSQSREHLGALYIERSAEWKPFSPRDIDYLMILALNAAASLQCLRYHNIGIPSNRNGQQGSV